MRTRKKHLGKIIAMLVPVVILVILGIVYFVMAMHFKDHFYYRTTINGVDCSGKTIEEVESMITQTITPYQIELQGRDGQTEVIRGTDIGLAPVFDGSLERELEACSGFEWPLSLFRDTNIRLETMVSCDEEKLREAVDALECVVQSDSRKPENAYISDYTEGIGYEIIPETEGAQVEKDLLLAALHTSIIGLEEELSLEETGCYREPQIRSDNQELQTALTQLNDAVSASITYEFGDAREVLDGNTIHNWVSLSADNQVVLDEAQAAAYVKELAAKYDTYGGTRSFTTYYGTTVQLGRNEYGWKINQAEETAQLLEDIQAGTTVSREPVFSRRGKSFGTKDYGNTYAEINLTAQRLYFYKDGNLLVETDIISGHIDAHPTPPGAFSVTYTQKGAILRGEDYASPVDFWMPFNGNIGMHDATWKSDFGGNYYTYTGSHGCINMPYEAAQTVFNNIKAGDPVFVYELAGTETEKYYLQLEADVVSNMIVSLPETITLDTKADIERARTSYEALPENVKPYVWPYDQLLAAEEAYAKLLAEQQGQQAQQDKAAAQAVIDAINAIGQVTADSRSAIEAARNQYNALSESAKAYVTNEAVLRQAEARLQDLLQP